jgi:hypothetical protein
VLKVGPTGINEDALFILDKAWDAGQELDHHALLWVSWQLNPQRNVPRVFEDHANGLFMSGDGEASNEYSQSVSFKLGHDGYFPQALFRYVE